MHIQFTNFIINDESIIQTYDIVAGVVHTYNVCIEKFNKTSNPLPYVYFIDEVTQKQYMLFSSLTNGVLTPDYIFACDEQKMPCGIMQTVQKIYQDGRTTYEYFGPN